MISALATRHLMATDRADIATVAAFGSNPGALRMLVYAPPRLRAGRPLVVVLHGCGQSAADFAADAGWLAEAGEFGVALLLPEQIYDNNRGRCFNWFRPEDVRRGSGESLSIRQMVRCATLRFGSDKRRIFVAGFSAGGSMAAALLAAYPAVFAAGGVVAGMPVGCAITQIGALLQMRRAGRWRTRAGLAEDVRGVSRSRSRRAWPRLSIWQGERDRTVDPANALALAAQWSELHRHGAEPTADTTISGARRRVWGKPNRPPAVELLTIEHLGHGFPIDAREPGAGHTGPWVVDAGLSAARHMAAFWGLESCLA